VDLPYGDEITYNWYSDVSGWIGTGQEINLTLPAGPHVITLNVTDSELAWCVTTIEIEVLEDPNKTDDDVDDDTDDDDVGEDQGFFSRFWWVFVVLVIVMVLVLVIILVMVLRKKGEAEEPPVTDAQEPFSEEEKVIEPEHGTDMELEAQEE
jgi:hypothetical protein